MSKSFSFTTWTFADMVGKEIAGYMIVPLYLEVFRLLNLSPTNHDPQNVCVCVCVWQSVERSLARKLSTMQGKPTGFTLANPT